MTRVLKKVLEENKWFIRLFVYYTLSAMLIDQIGFEVIGMIGYDVASILALASEISRREAMACKK